MLFQALRTSAQRSLATRFSLSIGALLLPLFALMGLGVMLLQEATFTRLAGSVGESFANIREIDIEAARSEETAKIEKLGKLMAAIAPAAIASYDFTALTKYASTAMETPGVCEVTYKMPDGTPIVSAKSKEHDRLEGSRSFDIVNEGSKMGVVTIGYHSGLLNDKIAELDKVFAAKNMVIKDLSNAALVNIGTFITFGLLMVSVITVGAIIFLFRRFVAVPLHEAVTHMQALAEGRLDIALAPDVRADEIGAIAKALDVFKRNAQEQAELRAHEQEKDEAARERTHRVTELCARFDGDVRAFFGSFEAAMASLESASLELGQLAETTTRQATSISAASQSVNENVSSVALASEELSASVREISRQINESTRLVRKTVEQTELTSSESEKLMTYAQRVNDVLDLISNISHQTRLLSLNATIEAERAGEMGKGFAVVANEVRVLAAQTEESVKQIQQTITDVQGASTRISTALEETKKDVNAVNDSSSIMASAAEKQSGSTINISQTMRSAADETDSVVRSLGKIVESASKTGDASSSVHQASSDLAAKARQLRESVESFLSAVKQA